MSANFVSDMTGKSEHIVIIITITSVRFTRSRERLEKNIPSDSAAKPWGPGVVHGHAYDVVHSMSGRARRSRAAAACLSFSRSLGVHRSRGLRRRWRRSGRIFSLPPPHSPYRWHAGASQMHFESVIKCTRRRRCEIALSDAAAAAIDFLRLAFRVKLGKF